MAEKISVHDPRGFPPKVEGKQLAPRLDRLDGKNVYLVDCLFDNSDIFMDEMMDWFSTNLPAVKTKISIICPCDRNSTNSAKTRPTPVCDTVPTMTKRH